MRTIQLIIILLICTSTYAQKDEVQKLNDLFQGKQVFALQKKGLKVDFIKGGEIFRTDFFRFSDINFEKISFNQDEMNVSIRCLETNPKCIDRKIVKTKSRQPVPRMTLKVNDEKQAQEAIEIFKNMVTEK